jgi:hypothetical protein
MSLSDNPVNFTDFGFAEPEFHAVLGFDAELPFWGRLSDGCTEFGLD